MTSKIKVDEIEESTGSGNITFKSNTVIPTGKTLTITDGLAVSTINSGTIADARISSSSITQHVAATDVTPVEQDILTLALHSAVTDNKAAHNLTSAFIDQFEDDTGIGTETTVDRTNEMVASVYDVAAAFSDDANTDMLLHMDDTALTDTAGNISAPTLIGTAARSSTQSKFGGYSVVLDGNSDALTYPDNAKFNYSTNDFTIEFWIRLNALADFTVISGRENDNNRYVVYINGTATQVQLFSRNGGSTGVNIEADYTFVINTWTHVAISRASGVIKIFVNGTSLTLKTNTTPSGIINNYSGTMAIGYRQDGSGYVNGYIDEVRFSDNARYSTNFTPNATPSSNATGTLIGVANVPSSAQTKVSGVALYKDNAGTATIGTDLKIYFTCNGGTNWTEAASYTAVTPVFSTGIKMLKLGETTCTSGSDVRYKAVWANQASGSKETQLHGIGVNY